VAAAANVLPTAAQAAVSGAAEHVGIHLPDGRDHRGDGSGGGADDHSGDRGNGPDATGPAAIGLCRAYQAHEESGDPGDFVGDVAYRELAKAAADADMTIDQFCDVDRRPTDTTVPDHEPTTTTRPAGDGERTTTTIRHDGEHATTTTTRHDEEHPTTTTTRHEQEHPTTTTTRREEHPTTTTAVHTGGDVTTTTRI
jgi:hypothetical protein